MKGRKITVIITVIVAFILVGTGIAAVSMNRMTGKKLTEAEPEINVTDTDLKEETDTEEVEAAVTESEAEQPDNAPSEAKQEPSGSTISGGTAQAAPQGSNNNGDVNSSTGTPTTQPASAGSNTPVQQPTVSETNIPPTQQPAATTTEHTPVWHEPVYKDVWVEDTPAWTEEVPVYETRERGVCYICGGYMYNQQEVDSHPCFGGWYTESYQVQVGTETETHPAEGHWEKVLVKEGYWE